MLFANGTIFRWCWLNEHIYMCSAMKNFSFGKSLKCDKGKLPAIFIITTYDGWHSLRAHMHTYNSLFHRWIEKYIFSIGVVLYASCCRCVIHFCTLTRMHHDHHQYLPHSGWCFKALNGITFFAFGLMYIVYALVYTLHNQVKELRFLYWQNAH